MFDIAYNYNFLAILITLETGIVCMLDKKERFIDAPKICNGNNDCEQKSKIKAKDELGCENGLYCQTRLDTEVVKLRT